MDIKSIIHSDPEIMGGKVVFVGTRVPVAIFREYLEGGYSIDELMAQYPTVKREQVLGLIAEAGDRWISRVGG